MSRRRTEAGPRQTGFLVVDKPAGWTSHDVVDAARRWLGTRRIGHLGTLDPLATGVLPLAVGDATKLVPFVQGGAKSYEVTIRLGVETDTQDADGKATREHRGPLPGLAALQDALPGFTGEIEQIPPMFSAIKRSGVPLYRLARRGEEVERAPKRVTIHRLRLLGFESPDARLEVVASAGTYMRSLAADLGERLGCGAHVTALRRVRSEPFGLDRAAPVEALQEYAERGTLQERLIPAADALGLPRLEVGDEQERRILHGGDIPAADPAAFPPGTRVAALDARGSLLAILESRPNRRLQPLRVIRSVATPK